MSSINAPIIQNQAAWLDTPDTPLRIGPATAPVPLPHEVLIKVHAIAINPVDCIRQTLGFSNATHPWIFGSDLAGTVEAIGSNVTRFQPGDHVTALANEYSSHLTTDAAFQAYMKTPETNVCKIPVSMAFTDACVLPLGLSTAAGMVFESVTLKLRLPTTPAPPSQSSSEVVVVWGGSSSVGASAIQMIRAAHYHVVGLSSPHNFPLMKACGADECFDYNDADLVEKLSTYVKEQGWTSAGILGAAGFLPPGPMQDETVRKTGDIARALGGRRFVSTPLARGFMEELDFGEGVGTSNVLGISEDAVRRAIWEEWMEVALESGSLKALPMADIVGEGLEGINEALAIARKGVSGKKVVVKIC